MSRRFSLLVGGPISGLVLALALLAGGAVPAHAATPPSGVGSGPASLVCMPPGPAIMPS